MAMMKQVVLGLSHRSDPTSATPTTNPIHIERLSSRPMTKSQLDDNATSALQPNPTVFVSIHSGGPYMPKGVRLVPKFRSAPERILDPS